jgi:release factor glutamine methyltransferase
MIKAIDQREYSEVVPPQYEDGFAMFMGLKIKVDPRVLIPRPETVMLVAQAARQLEETGRKNFKVVDMCTGSGAVAIGLSSILAGAKIKAADVSAEALEIAKENVLGHRFHDRIELVESDMFSKFGREDMRAYDAVVSNPPYVSDRDFQRLDTWVKAEPALALYAGKNGMDYIDILCKKSGMFLKKGAFLALEIGYDQSAMVQEKMKENGFLGLEVFKDPGGHDRVITGRVDG